MEEKRLDHSHHKQEDSIEVAMPARSRRVRSEGNERPARVYAHVCASVRMCDGIVACTSREKQMKRQT